MSTQPQPVNRAPYAQGFGFELRRDGHLAVSASDLYLPGVGITCVVGPNGSGKTTLLHALGGLVPASAGELTVLGEEPSKVRRKVSYVLQNATLPHGFPLTVAEVVAMARYPQLGLVGRPDRRDRRIVAEAMDRLDVTNLADRHLTELSGGQRQRVYVAQGLAQEHSVLLLDEPLTGLDLVSARTIDRVVTEEADAGRTVIMTTHDLSQAANADYVVLMNGVVVAFGHPDEALTDENLREAYGLSGLHPHQENQPAQSAPVPAVEQVRLANPGHASGYVDHQFHHVPEMIDRPQHTYSVVDEDPGQWERPERAGIAQASQAAPVLPSGPVRPSTPGIPPLADYDPITGPQAALRRGRPPEGVADNWGGAPRLLAPEHRVEPERADGHVRSADADEQAPSGRVGRHALPGTGDETQESTGAEPQAATQGSQTEGNSGQQDGEQDADARQDTVLGCGQQPTRSGRRAANRTERRIDQAGSHPGYGPPVTPTPPVVPPAVNWEPTRPQMPPPPAANWGAGSPPRVGFSAPPDGSDRRYPPDPAADRRRASLGAPSGFERRYTAGRTASPSPIGYGHGAAYWPSGPSQPGLANSAHAPCGPCGYAHQGPCTRPF